MTVVCCGFHRVRRCGVQYRRTRPVCPDVRDSDARVNLLDGVSPKVSAGYHAAALSFGDLSNGAESKMGLHLLRLRKG